MTAAAAEIKMTTKLKALDTAKLKEVIVAVFKDPRDGTELVMRFAMNELETRIPEAEFVNFLDKLN